MQPEVPLHHHRDAIGVVLVIDAKTDADRVVDGADEAVVDQLDAAAKSKPDVVVIIERRQGAQQQMRLGLEGVVDVAARALDLTPGRSGQEQGAETDRSAKRASPRRSRHSA